MRELPYVVVLHLLNVIGLCLNIGMQASFPAAIFQGACVGLLWWRLKVLYGEANRKA